MTAEQHIMDLFLIAMVLFIIHMTVGLCIWPGVPLLKIIDAILVLVFLVTAKHKIWDLSP